MQKSLSLLLTSLILVISFNSEAAGQRIGILVYDKVLTSDVTAPLEVFGIASRKSWFSNYDVITISVEQQEFITTEEGLKLGVDAWIGDLPELDALILTSSYEMDHLLENSSLMDFIRSTAAQDAWMASNCSGALLLAHAGLLDGKKATTWFGGESKMQKSYPKVKMQSDTNLVVDGKYVTSNGGLVSYQAALKLLHLMSSKGKAETVADVIQYERISNAPY